MISGAFSSPEDSHAHSLATLNCLYEYDDFMGSVKTLVDMGCGAGLDMEWWATRQTRDDTPKPLNIKCTGIDWRDPSPLRVRHRNIVFQSQDFEEPIMFTKSFDIIWCHDAFQYVVDPFRTLMHWRSVLNTDGMLILILPQNTNLVFNQQIFDQRDGVYWNWTMVSLIHVLAVMGFDCAGGFFRKNPDDPWLHAVVYKGTQEPLDPRTTSWYHLADRGLLPESAVKSIEKHGYLRQRDLVLPWLDKSAMWMGQH